MEKKHKFLQFLPQSTHRTSKRRRDLVLLTKTTRHRSPDSKIQKKRKRKKKKKKAKQDLNERSRGHESLAHSPFLCRQLLNLWERERERGRETKATNKSQAERSYNEPKTKTKTKNKKIPIKKIKKHEDKERTNQRQNHAKSSTESHLTEHIPIRTLPDNNKKHQ